MEIRGARHAILRAILDVKELEGRRCEAHRMLLKLLKGENGIGSAP